MDIEARRDLKLLEAVEKDSRVTQRGLATKLGIDSLNGTESQGLTVGQAIAQQQRAQQLVLGQGLPASPLELASAYAAVANHGVWVTPHLVDHVIGGSRPKVVHRRVLSPAIAQQVLSMLVNVVAEGTGTLAHVPGYVVAGKTGTAAKPDPRTGGYSTSKYVASFVGIVPATAPRLLILVTVDEPQGAIFGGTVAAPIFQEIARFALQYLEVPPDNPSDLQNTSSAATSSAVTSSSSTSAGATSTSGGR